MAIAANFKISKFFTIVGIGLILTGDIIDGEITAGNFIQINFNNITFDLIIDSVEHVDYTAPKSLR
ncbi:hypothetical protein [Mucilaginibacter agri]|uniref:Uncharacterized protein n=1 Tax=Mucilaginibacter agri TaxID=2695265 RepID=A0A965ZGB9_9SPHI|nr:hypothetical protein [Mucilaginibacter agri]NCD70533.1 hypothetical protein [Mucilaginibacter agri]